MDAESSLGEPKSTQRAESLRGAGVFGIDLHADTTLMDPSERLATFGELVHAVICRRIADDAT